MSDVRWWIFDRFERAHLTEFRRDSVAVNALCGLSIVNAYFLCEATGDDRRCVSCQREADLRVRAVGLHARDLDEVGRPI